MRFTVTRWVARIYWLRLENEDRLKNIPTITQSNAETIETGLTTMTRKKIGPLTVREDRARSSRQRRMTTQSHRAVGGCEAAISLQGGTVSSPRGIDCNFGLLPK